MKRILLWVIPLAYLILANTTIQKITGFSTLDAYIVYKVGFAILLLVGVIFTHTTKEVGTSLNLNVGVIKYLWLFGVFACLQIFAAFSIGLMLGVARLKDTTIWMVVIAHTLINFSTFVSVGLGNPELNTSEVLMWVIPSLAFFLMGVFSLKDLSKI